MRYRSGRRETVVLDDVWLEIDAGQLVGLFGLRRSGKSTLLRVAAGIERPDAGLVRLEGRPLVYGAGARRAGLPPGIGFVATYPHPQGGSRLRHMTVLDRVAMPLVADGTDPDSALARAHEALERVGVADCAEAAPFELGPGEATRVAIGRALLTEPRVLIVDEPAVTPSPTERDEIHDLLRSLAAAGLGLLVASEDVAVLRGCDRALLVRAGAVVSARGKVVPFPQRKAGGRERRAP
jgi:predicted ABC-type transport system involved in lysophospholipase L1 biosynthesis ATPase subunit